MFRARQTLINSKAPLARCLPESSLFQTLFLSDDVEGKKLNKIHEQQCNLVVFCRLSIFTEIPSGKYVVLVRSNPRPFEKKLLRKVDKSEACYKSRKMLGFVFARYIQKTYTSMFACRLLRDERRRSDVTNLEFR